MILPEAQMNSTANKDFIAKTKQKVFPRQSIKNKG